MKAAHRLIIARIAQIVLTLIVFIAFEGMLAGIAFNLTVPYFVLACTTFGSGAIVLAYLVIYTIPRLGDEAFEERWNDPAYVARMAKYL